MFDFIRSWFRKISDATLEKIAVLNKVKLFENCREKDLVSIARCCRLVELEEGEMLIEKGGAGDGLYIIDSGRVSVKLSKNGENVATMGEGEYIGEMSLLDREPRSAYIFCESPGRALFLPGEEFMSLIKETPRTGSKVLFVLALTLSRRLRSTNRQLREMSADRE